MPKFTPKQHAHVIALACRTPAAGHARWTLRLLADRVVELGRAIQDVPEIQQEYQRCRRRKGKAIARALVAKELATIVYAVLKKGEVFDGTFHGQILTRSKRQQWPRLASPPAELARSRTPHA